MRQSFGMNERLKSREAIENLFAEGNRMTVFPLKVYYLPDEIGGRSQAAFSVPKKRFGKAVERNLIKRRMREAYRLNKEMLSKKSHAYALLLVYIGEHNCAYSQIESALKEVFKKI